MKYTIKDYKERFYIGIEYPGGVVVGADNTIKKTWTDFFDNDYQYIENVKDGGKFIGLECYPPDFSESKTFDYYALCEVSSLAKQEGFVSKKLPEGKYISFPVKMRELKTEIGNVYRFIKENNIKVSNSFDYEDYLSEEDYSKKDAILNFCLKMAE